MAPQHNTAGVGQGSLLLASLRARQSDETQRLGALRRRDTSKERATKSIDGPAQLTGYSLISTMQTTWMTTGRRGGGGGGVCGLGGECVRRVIGETAALGGQAAVPQGLSAFQLSPSFSTSTLHIHECVARLLSPGSPGHAWRTGAKPCVCSVCTYSR